MEQKTQIVEKFPRGVRKRIATAFSLNPGYIWLINTGKRKHKDVESVLKVLHKGLEAEDISDFDTLMRKKEKLYNQIQHIKTS